MGSGGSKRGSGGGAAGSKKSKAKKNRKAVVKPPVATPPDETTATVTVDVRPVVNGAAASATPENGTIQNEESAVGEENGATAGEKETDANTTSSAAADPPAAAVVTLRPKNPQQQAAATKTRAGISATGRGNRTSFYEMVDAAEILPHLVMGNLASARNTGFLRGKHVAYVLDLTTEGEVPAASREGSFLRELGIQHLHVEIEDDEDEEILGHFDTCFEFINKAASKTKNTAEEKKKRHSGPGTQHKTVLVHSNYGLSRTSAIVLGYLIKEKGWSLREAHEHLRKCHTAAKPNDGFVVQLLHYEQDLRGSMSLTLKDFYKQP